METLWSAFVISANKFLFVLGVARTDPFFCAGWAQKWQFLEVLAKNFQKYLITIKVININWIPNIFYWKPAKNKQTNKNKLGVVLGQYLSQIRSNVVRKSKETGIINKFFSYLHREYILRHNVVVVQTS